MTDLEKILADLRSTHHRRERARDQIAAGLADELACDQRIELLLVRYNDALAGDSVSA
jgi:hypothetical protein